MGDEKHLTDGQFSPYKPESNRPTGGLELAQSMIAHAQPLSRQARRGVYELSRSFRPPDSRSEATATIVLRKGEKYTSGVQFRTCGKLYQLSPTGDISRVDEAYEWSYDPNSDEGQIIFKAIDTLGYGVRQLARYADEARAWRVTLWRRWIIGILAVGLVASGISAWVYYGKLLPDQVAATQRAEYDNAQHQLPGTSNQTVAIRPATMSDQDFSQIPPIGGDDDTLANPRIVELRLAETNGSRICASVPQLRADVKYRLAVAQSSTYVQATFYAGLGTNSGTALCTQLMGNTTQLAVAIQVVQT